MSFDPNRLYTQLLNTGMQNTNPPQYQLIRSLIGVLADLFKSAGSGTGSGTSSTVNITSNPVIFLPGQDGEDGDFGVPGPMGPAGPAASPGLLIRGEVPTGLINGSNTVFTTANNYTQLAVYLNGLRQEKGLDYTETSANTFTFLQAPLPGDIVTVDYGTGGTIGSTGPQGPTGTFLWGDDGIDGDTGPPGVNGIPLLVAGAESYNSASQTITNLVETVIALNTNNFDTSGFWNAGSPNIFTVPVGKAGTYYITGQVKWNLSNTGASYLRIYKNSTTLIAEAFSPNTDNNSVNQVVALTNLVDGDTITLKVIINMVSNQPTVGGIAQTYFGLSMTGGSTGGAIYTAGTGITISSNVISTVPAGMVLLEEHTASSSATLDFTTAITSTYDDYLFELVNLIPATTSVDFYWRYSTNGGSTYDSSSLYFTSLFAWAFNGTAFSGQNGISPVAQITLRNTGDISNDSHYGVSGFIKLYSPLSASLYKQALADVGYLSGSTLEGIVNRSNYINTTAVNAVRFFFSSGNISSGTIRCYGLSK